eukprot:Nk52_evm21s2630 gene=Nk52_evmTU21s2630
MHKMMYKFDDSGQSTTLRQTFDRKLVELKGLYNDQGGLHWPSLLFFGIMVNCYSPAVQIYTDYNMFQKFLHHNDHGGLLKALLTKSVRKYCARYRLEETFEACELCDLDWGTVLEKQIVEYMADLMLKKIMQKYSSANCSSGNTNTFDIGDVDAAIHQLNPLVEERVQKIEESAQQAFGSLIKDVKNLEKDPDNDVDLHFISDEHGNRPSNNAIWSNEELSSCNPSASSIISANHLWFFTQTVNKI